MGEQGMNLLFRWGLVLGAIALMLGLPGQARGDAEGLWAKVNTVGSPGPGGAEIRVEIMSSDARPAAMVTEAYAADASIAVGKRKLSQLRRSSDGIFVGRVLTGKTGGPGRVDLYIRVDDDSIQHGIVSVDIASPVMLELGTHMLAVQTDTPVWTPWLWAVAAALAGAGVFRALIRRRRPSI